MFESLSEISTTREQFEKFKRGELAEDWFKRYPELFDDDDIRVARTQAKMGLHYYEWLSALTIYQSTEYLSLIESYEFKVQKRKQKIIKDLLPEKVLEAILMPYDDSRKAQCPDLLCFKPDYSDWFFCEVKGPTDKLRDVQEDYFAHLSEASGKPIKVVNLRWLS
ncbi:MAG: VRR-NUC domain-containing protein [Gammaproteobacteria bacterium]|nr:VRR-NUC domain-containing protein [Gammaproteobacteria bacterium]